MALCGLVVLAESTKYEAPPKYETMDPKPATPEAKPMEYKKEEPKAPEYPKTEPEPKTEYGKTPEPKMEYGKKPEPKMEYGKMDTEKKSYSPKMEYKKKTYKRSVDEDDTQKEADPKKNSTDDQVTNDPYRKEIKIIRRDFIKKILSDPVIRYALVTYPVYIMYRRHGIWLDGEDEKQDDPARSVDPDLTAEPDMMDEDREENNDFPPGSGRPMKPPVHHHRGRPINYMKRPMTCRRICY